jgi:hypothetical protein
MLVRRINSKFDDNPICQFVILKNNDKTLIINAKNFNSKKSLIEIEKELL